MAGGSAGLRLATRGSALALAQARLVAGMLEGVEPGVRVELVPVRTSGDEGSARAGTQAPSGPVPGDKSRFVKEIEDALLAGAADVAVHSAKDVPGDLPAGLEIVGVPARADPRDALCGAGSIAALPAGARVGTSSLRRRAQLLAAREDLEVDELRGNVDTRLRRLGQGDYDAVVLAAAGLERLGVLAGEPVDPAVMIPAAGQGCLALEARAGDQRVAELAAAVTDADALMALTAERAVTATLEASCDTPIGVHAELTGEDGSELTVASFVGRPDGSAWLRDSVAGEARAPAELGLLAGERLLSAGAAEVLSSGEVKRS
ncbi:MAG: hydroxymethylbilane synthase [Thermoleophilaceae bacterium]|nr:hydroxymethylbilane synthase [Thermoleophilaceae bacterium]